MIVIHVRRWLGRLRFMFLFAVFTFLMYHMLLFVSHWIEPLDKYKEPNGQAVKAFQHEHAALTDQATMGQRLKLFYWIGE